MSNVIYLLPIQSVREGYEWWIIVSKFNPSRRDNGHPSKRRRRRRQGCLNDRRTRWKPCQKTPPKGCDSFPHPRWKINRGYNKHLLKKSKHSKRWMAICFSFKYLLYQMKQKQKAFCLNSRIDFVNYVRVLNISFIYSKNVFI